MKKFLANPDDYSLDDVLGIGNDELYNVSSELRARLVELVNEKTKKKFIPYELPTEDEEEVPPLEDEEDNCRLGER